MHSHIFCKAWKISTTLKTGSLFGIFKFGSYKLNLRGSNLFLISLEGYVVITAKMVRVKFAKNGLHASWTNTITSTLYQIWHHQVYFVFDSFPICLQYLFCYFVFKEFPDQTSDCHWSEERFKHVIQLRQQGLEHARNSWSDFVFVSSPNAFIFNALILYEQVI